MSNNEETGLPALDVEHRPTFRDFYYLMKWKVTKILLVSSLYDAFTLEEEGLLTEQISGEYQELALSSPPQVVRVPSGEQALKELGQSRYDLVITMSQVVDVDPCEFCGQARHIQHDVPVMLLATTPDEVSMFLAGEERDRFDRAFYWTGDATLLLAIIKCVEDKRNIVADTQHGVVKVILVIEDSPMAERTIEFVFEICTIQNGTETGDRNLSLAFPFLLDSARMNAIARAFSSVSATSFCPFSRNRKSKVI